MALFLAVLAACLLLGMTAAVAGPPPIAGTEPSRRPLSAPAIETLHNPPEMFGFVAAPKVDENFMSGDVPAEGTQGAWTRTLDEQGSPRATFGQIDMSMVKVTIATLACSKRLEDATAFAQLVNSRRGREVFKKHGMEHELRISGGGNTGINWGLYLRDMGQHLLRPPTIP